MLRDPIIMACTDFSPYSDMALKAAEELRIKTNGKLYVLHVSEIPVIWDWIPEGGTPSLLDEKFEFELMKSLRMKIDRQMRECGVNGEPHISLGLAHAQIANEISERKVDLLVLGHKGKTGGIFRLGSIAEKLVASATIPVLVTKGPFQLRKLSVLADPTTSMKELVFAGESLAELFSARLEVVSLFSDLSARFIGIGKLGFSTELLTFSENERRELVRSAKEQIQQHLKNPDSVDIRIEFTTERKMAPYLSSILRDGHTDLAIMRRHQGTLLEKILIGSETRRMLELSDRNLLILPP